MKKKVWQQKIKQIIKNNQKEIKTINKKIKTLYKNYDQQILINLQTQILNNVRQLNKLSENIYKNLNKNKQKEIFKKINLIYLAYLQLNNKLQSLEDIND